MAARYEHPHPGDPLHGDMKKLGRVQGLGHRIGERSAGVHSLRGVGWEPLHVAVDDHSRVAYVESLGAERTPSVRAFVGRALRWFRGHGVRVRRILTDNGSAYRSHSFRAACRALRIVHRRTRPYTPRTNGKAERLIQTTLREWPIGGHTTRPPIVHASYRGGSSTTVAHGRIAASVDQPP